MRLYSDIKIFPAMVSPGVLPPMPRLQFSGLGAPTVEEFLAALESQLSVGLGLHHSTLPGLISARLTGRALLWYTEEVRGHHFKPNDAGYRDLRGRLVSAFSLRDASPVRAFRALTQGGDTVAAYAARFRQLAARVGEDEDSYLNRMWWAYGLNEQLRDAAVDRIPAHSSLKALADEVHGVARRRSRGKDGAQRSVACRQGRDAGGDHSTQGPQADTARRTTSDGRAGTGPRPGVTVPAVQAGKTHTENAELVKLYGEVLLAHLRQGPAAVDGRGSVQP